MVIEVRGSLGHLSAGSGRPAQRLGLTVVVGGPEAPGSLLAPATVNRILAAISSFYDWAVVAEEYDGDSPMQKRLDPALARCRPGISRSWATRAVSSRCAAR
ncbi:hypothetical protein [Streptomyces sp. NPDC060027]|uniref:hypothetical protein n=1 Tax=Streptomyces sp. NPDC060027 TaxID=3347040 RepID=UPI0036805C31